MPGRLYRSAFTRPGVTPADVLAFHRSVFGDARMSNDDGALNGGDGGNGGSGGDGGNAGTGSTDNSGTGTGAGSGAGGNDGDRGFPADTPLAEMTVEQREAYWKHQARKHESRANARADYDTIKAELEQRRQASETDAEKAVREAKEAGKAEARTEAVNDTVKAMLRMGLRARGVKDEDLDEVVSTINLSAHADDSGAVDDEKVLRTINRLAGTANSGGTGPDTGQGNRGSKTSKSGVSAGAEMFAAARGKKSTTT